MPGMRGGGMMPGMGGGMGQPTSQPLAPGAFGSAITPQSRMFSSQQNLSSAMESLQRMEEQCARGSGSACISAQSLRQRVAQMQAEHDQQLGMQQMGARMRGNNPVGRGGGQNMGSYASAMLGAMFGMPGGGGGSMGSGGGW